MKRWILRTMCLLLVCLMSVSCAMAEGTGEWVFRNGVTWNSTKEEVIASEGTEPDIEDLYMYNGRYGIMYDASVSKYSAELAYMFEDDALLCALYRLEDMDEASYSYMKAAIASKYGESMRVDEEYLLKLFNCIDTMENTKLCHVENWMLEDGTRIVLCCMEFYWDEDFSEYTADYTNAFLVYWDEPRLLESGGLYNTNGL